VSRSKDKGTRFETAVVRFLGRWFPACERRALTGKHDKGDIAGVPGWTLELKNTASLDLAGALNEAKAEAANAGTRYYAAVFSRRMKPVEESYAVVPLWVLAELIAGDVEAAA
jgi:hypothetical protein